jgi:peptidoglycan L-alanyl-D-glutamate endopeptidase CwlK
VLIRYRQILTGLLSILLLLFSFTTSAGVNEILRLQKAYPKHIQTVSDDFIIWADGTMMPTQDGVTDKTNEDKLASPSLIDQVHDVIYLLGIPTDTTTYNPISDPGRIRFEPFFRKMYGDSQEEVESKLVTIYWMPLVFGNNYPLLVTTVNHVDKKLTSISNELEDLVAKHPDYIPFLDAPGGTFKWRVIANTNRLSNHSFGMTIDINASLSDYWQWDLERAGQSISEHAPLIYRNSVPWEIIPIFEKYGFIWGGKWQHYDSMHFEYRPELLI